MKVLLVDDDAVSIALASATVMALGHECHEAADGLAALSMLRRGDFDIVISDWHMPVLDGLELCRRVRVDPSLRYPYFLLLTGSGSTASIISAMEAGVDDHLIKPIDAERLQARLIAGERVSSLHRQLAERQALLEDALIELREKKAALEEGNRNLFALAHKDPLTGLRNRLQLEVDIELLSKRPASVQDGFVVAMIDIDHFKTYNDTHGHQAGDTVLAQSGVALTAAVRPHDLVYRYGGEEFLVIYLNAGIPGAVSAADRLRAQLTASCLTAGLPGPVTVSIGLAEASAHEPFPNVLKRADDALYRAKRAGRNRSELAPLSA